MQITGTSIELMAKDVAISMAFYQEVFGFHKLAEELDDGGKVYWGLLQKDAFRLSFKEEHRLKSEAIFMRDKTIGASIAICFQVDDLEGYYEEIQLRCEALEHPHLTPCGSHQFSLSDKDGYVITIEKFHHD
ncbi:MAG: VOC family protein [Bacteroidota bacterium]